MELKNIIYIIDGFYAVKGVPEKEILEEIISTYTNRIEFSIEPNKINIQIESDENQSESFAVFLQIKNKLKDAFKKIRVGIREFKVTSALIKIKINEEQKEAINKIKIQFVESIEIEDGYALLKVSSLDEWFLKNQFIRNIPKVFLEKIEHFQQAGKKEYWELLWISSNQCSGNFNEDPTNAILNQGWVKRYPLQGVFFFTPKITAIIRALEKIAFEEVIKKLNFEEAIFPKQVPFEVWSKSGHLVGVPSEIFYLSVPKVRENELFDDINDIIKITKTVPNEKYPSRLRDPISGFCYAQCPPFYWFFGDELVSEDTFPVKWFDRSGPSFRWESGGLHGIERLNEFHRIELVWLDRIDGAIGIRDALMDCYKHVFEDIFQIEWRLAKVTPWYYAHSGNLVGVEYEKERGTIDYESYLPYRGPRETAEWLEFQNISLHGDKFINAFNIKCNKDIQLWTGCSGIGTERWIVTLMAQYGTDLDQWPEGMQKYLEEAKEIKNPKLISQKTY